MCPTQHNNKNKCKKKKETNFLNSEDVLVRMEKCEPWYFVSGDIKWCSGCGKQCGLSKI
jgi:hypothetical protein